MDINTIFTIPLIIGFVFVVTYLFKDLVLDTFREHLFTLRGKLFDYVAVNDRTIFNTGAYKDLERKINMIIKWAEIYKPSTVIALIIKRNSKGAQHIVNEQDRLNKEFRNDLKALGDGHADFFSKIDDDLNDYLLAYIIFSSWSMMFAIMFGFVLLALLLVFESMWKFIKNPLGFKSSKYRLVFKRAATRSRTIASAAAVACYSPAN